MQSRRRALPSAGWKCAPLAPRAGSPRLEPKGCGAQSPHATQPNFIPAARLLDGAGKELFFRLAGIAAPRGNPSHLLEGDPLSVRLDDGNASGAFFVPSFRG